MNEEVIFDSFPSIENVIASNVVRAVSYLHSRVIIRKDRKPANVLVSNSHYKSHKHEELKMEFSKKPIACKLSDLGEARSMYTQTNALTGKNCTATVHRGSLAFMVPEMIIEELSIAQQELTNLKLLTYG